MLAPTVLSCKQRQGDKPDRTKLEFDLGSDYVAMVINCL